MGSHRIGHSVFRSRRARGGFVRLLRSGLAVSVKHVPIMHSNIIERYHRTIRDIILTQRFVGEIPRPTASGSGRYLRKDSVGKEKAQELCYKLLFRREHCDSRFAQSLVGSCRMTGELMYCRLWRLGAVAVSIYKLLFAHAGSTGVGQ